MALTFIINPIAGGIPPGEARRRAELAAAVTSALGDTADVFITERRGHARELTESAVIRGARCVFAWGGDGTLNEVASALAFRDVPLAIVPAGSGNGLARELGVDFRPERAIADAMGATARTIDLGEVDGRLFVNLAGVGFDAYVATAFDNRGAKRRGFAGYLSVAGRALISYKPQEYAITTTEGRVRSRAILVTFANSAQFGNDARIAPGALMDDGLLDLVVVEERARWRTVCNVPRLFNGTIQKMQGCSITRVREATVESAHPIAFHVDGEPVAGGTRLQVCVHPRALRVAVR